MLLEVVDARLSYGKVTALRGISLSVPANSVVTIIGANGAGKTTTLRAISGLARISSGEIRLEDRDISGLPPDKIVSLGISHVPEGRRVFPEMTVEENLRTGAFLRHDSHEVDADLDDVFSRFPKLEQRRTKNAKTLSGGEQQMLAIGRALMARPKLLMLDEPSMGLAPVVVDEIADIIRQISGQGVPVILVEQNAELALTLSDYAYVLETGTVALEGDADTLRNNEHVRAAYLGV